MRAISTTNTSKAEARMTDIELTRALERGDVANETFGHVSHLHVAWVYLSESSSVNEAADKIRKFASSAGKPEKYHETITLFWIYLLSRLHASEKSLQEILRANPRLLAKNFPLAYYSAERLFSERARSVWVEPDLKPLFFDATTSCSSSPPCDTSDRALSR
jgi:hypothetical protein